MNELEMELCQCIDSMHDEIVTFLQEIVSCDSHNPPGDTRKVADVIKSKLESCGIDYENVVVDEIHESIVATINQGAKPNLLYNSHIDTVPVGNPSYWQYDPFKEKAKDGRLYGRGVADAKGCVAGMVMAAKALKLCNVELKGSLSINPVADEEMGGIRGVKNLIDQKKLDPDMVVIGEISENKIAIAHKGIIWFELISHGRTAHASTPWDGTNAISKMVKFLYRLEECLQKRLVSKRHPLTPPPSYNIGVIEGGVKANVVADICKVVLDRRILPSETLEEAVQEINDVIRAVQEEDPETQISLEVISYGAPLETHEDEPLVQVALTVAQDFGIENVPVGYQQASDGRYFSEMNIPTILLGPGIPSEAHSPNESILIEEVIQATKMYALLAMRILGNEY